MDKYEHYCTLLNQYDKELDEIYHRYAMEHHLSDAALWILYAIHDARGTITQADICNTWYFSRQTINTALKNLEQQGIIELNSIPANRKSKQIIFTKEGADIAQKLLTPLLTAERSVFSSLSDEENRLFLELCQKRCTLLREALENDNSSARNI